MVIKRFFYKSILSHRKLISIFAIGKKEKANYGNNDPKQSSHIWENSINFTILSVNYLVCAWHQEITLNKLSIDSSVSRRRNHFFHISSFFRQIFFPGEKVFIRFDNVFGDRNDGFGALCVCKCEKKTIKVGEFVGCLFLRRVEVGWLWKYRPRKISYLTGNPVVKILLDSSRVSTCNWTGGIIANLQHSVDISLTFGEEVAKQFEFLGWLRAHHEGQVITFETLFCILNIIPHFKGAWYHIDTNWRNGCLIVVVELKDVSFYTEYILNCREVGAEDANSKGIHVKVLSIVSDVLRYNQKIQRCFQKLLYHCTEKH